MTKNNENMNFKVEVVVKCPEGCKKMEEYKHRELERVVTVAIAAFEELADTYLNRDEVKWLVDRVEDCAVKGHRRHAIELLEAMYLVTGNNAANELHRLLELIGDDESMLSDFIEEMFDDPAVDWYLIDNCIERWDGNNIDELEALFN